MGHDISCCTCSWFVTVQSGKQAANYKDQDFDTTERK
jgi:hypothetical protein